MADPVTTTAALCPLHGIPDCSPLLNGCGWQPGREVVHQGPPDGSGLMPCCDRTPFEVPAYHRMTYEADRVTCGGRRD